MRQLDATITAQRPLAFFAYSVADAAELPWSTQGDLLDGLRDWGFPVSTEVERREGFEEVRAYHDARMLEVGMFQSHRRVAARYDYPNARMFAQDEKYQQIRFLADWLEHCLQNGSLPLELSPPPADAQ